ESENTIPVYWHPLDCRELLNEMWTNNCYVNMLEVKDILLNPDEQEAENIYNQITTSVKSIDDFSSQIIPEKGKFIMLKRILYELWVSEQQMPVNVDFLLPFNAINFFRTKYWFVKSLDNNLEIKMKRIHTEVKPPQEGMIITLPVEFRMKSYN
ncbi:MAG: hypothetical protein N3E50_07125, partial [Candidatus Goldbacteria bacterium]|nr:hypothetical protein [Candidatus Goldiibacteriota bacterium]